MEHKLIKKFLPELKMFPINWKDDLTFSDHGIKASDLEAELAKGVEVFGQRNQYGATDISLNKNSARTYSGLLIGYQPIESSKPVSREELKTYLMGYEIGLPSKAHEILKRILENGVK